MEDEEEVPEEKPVEKKRKAELPEKQQKKPKVENKENVAEKKKEKKAEEKKEKKVEEKKPEEKSAEPAEKTLPSGLVMKDTKVGNGAKAKPGKKVAVRYIGKLQNGKVFDSNTKGAPFTFKLGAGEVIKGTHLCPVSLSV